MLSMDVVNALRAFLNRVNLTGQEVPAYNKCMAQLAAVENEHRIRAEKESAQPVAAPEPSQE